MIDRLNIKISREEHDLTGRALWKRVMNEWFPLSKSITGICINYLPSPLLAQSYRTSWLYTGSYDDPIAVAMRACSSSSHITTTTTSSNSNTTTIPTLSVSSSSLPITSGTVSPFTVDIPIVGGSVASTPSVAVVSSPPLVMQLCNVVKRRDTKTQNVTLGRIFSGTIKSGIRPLVKLPSLSPSSLSMSTVSTKPPVMQRVFASCSRELILMEEIGAGNVALILGYANRIGSQATCLLSAPTTPSSSSSSSWDEKTISGIGLTSLSDASIEITSNCIHCRIITTGGSEDGACKEGFLLDLSKQMSRDVADCILAMPDGDFYLIATTEDELIERQTRLTHDYSSRSESQFGRISYGTPIIRYRQRMTTPPDKPVRVVNTNSNGETHILMTCTPLNDDICHHLCQTSPTVSPVDRASVLIKNFGWPRGDAHRIFCYGINESHNTANIMISSFLADSPTLQHKGNDKKSEPAAIKSRILQVMSFFALITHYCCLIASMCAYGYCHSE
jgi:translation elongation factor EF-G